MKKIIITIIMKNEKNKKNLVQNFFYAEPFWATAHVIL